MNRESEADVRELKLSVIIPVYNVAMYLRRCVESLLVWDEPAVEYLFVNDGSTDDSAEILSAYAKRDKRVRVIEKDNGGCASARNAGLARARGTYIGFVDGDDFIDPSMFDKLLNRAQSGHYDLAFCGYWEYHETEGICKPMDTACRAEPYISGAYQEQAVQYLAVCTGVAIWRFIYKREMLEQNHIRFHEDLRMFDDLPFRVESIFAAQSAVSVPECLYYYRLGRDGQDVACSDERLYVHFRIFEHLDRFVLPMKNKRLTDYLQIVKLNTHGYALNHIDKKFYRGYRMRARKQLDENMGWKRTVCIMLIYGGRRNLGWYLRSEGERVWRR